MNALWVEVGSHSPGQGREGVSRAARVQTIFDLSAYSISGPPCARLPRSVTIHSTFIVIASDLKWKCLCDTSRCVVCSISNFTIREEFDFSTCYRTRATLWKVAS